MTSKHNVWQSSNFGRKGNAKNITTVKDGEFSRFVFMEDVVYEADEPGSFRGFEKKSFLHAWKRVW